MKKYLILFCFAFLLFTCGNNEKSNTDDSTVPGNETTEVLDSIPVKITGMIENPVDEKVSIRGKGLKQEAIVTEGKFVLDFKLTEPTYLIFQHGSESGGLYLEPGDEANLTLNPEMFDETLKLEGKGAEESNYLLAKYLLNEPLDKELEAAFPMSAEAYAKKLDKIKDKNYEHFSKFKKENQEINSAFLETEKANIVYENALNKLNYKNYYKWFTKEEAPDWSSNYLSFMDNIDLNNELDYKNNNNYPRLVSTYFNQIGASAGEGTAKLDAIFETVTSKITNSTIKEGVLYATLNNFIRGNDASGIEKFVEKYNKISTDDKKKEALAKNYEIALNLLEGKPAPKFTYENTSGEKVALESLKGKNVYIDVWATWCGPCKAEIPHLKKLEKTYHGNDHLVFMSVSIDALKDKDKWMKMVEEKELGGLQLMADNAWKSSICTEYGINGIPRFILIDKAGNILDKDAPRPSSKEIKEILATLSKPGLTSMK